MTSLQLAAMCVMMASPGPGARPAATNAGVSAVAHPFDASALADASAVQLSDAGAPAEPARPPNSGAAVAALDAGTSHALATVRAVHGTVWRAEPGGREWLPAQKDDPLEQGARLVTGGSG